MRRLLPLLCPLLAVAWASAASGQNGAGVAAPARLPVREVTVFKDGHAFVLHRGRMPVSAQGTVQMDHLPVPILGTFWPYSADASTRLASVTASARKISVERTASTIRDLLLANPGAQVRIVQTDGKTHSGQVVGIPEPDPQDEPSLLETTNAGMGGFGGGLGGGFGPGSPSMMRMAVPGSTLLLRTADGVTAIPLGLIQTVTFKGEHRRRLSEPQVRNLLTLKLDRPAGGANNADVGLFYLQRGIRWIPNYRLSLDGNGSAVVELQATLLNEMVDLEDVTANLVIGVPTFFFKDQPDPISLQQAFPQLSRYFQSDSQTALGFSNAIMSQGGFGGMGGGFGGAAPRRCGPPEEVAEEQEEPALGNLATDKNEDLFVFTVRNVTLKRGQSMVLPVARVTLPYRDVYAVDLPFAPPVEVSGNLNAEQQAELARLLRTPRAQHRIRLRNTGPNPLTTAPVLMVRDERVIAQTMMQFTPTGGEADLTVTTAGEIQVRKTETEVKRTPNAVVHNGTPLTRVDLQGRVTLVNRGMKAVDVEVTRYVLGNVDSATRDGRIQRVNVFDDDSFLTGDQRPSWWSHYSWPSWWFQRNGVARITWTVRLDPGQQAELEYDWHHFAA